MNSIRECRQRADSNLPQLLTGRSTRVPEQQLRHRVSKLAHRHWLLNDRFGLPEHRTRLEELVLVAGAEEHLYVRAALMKPLCQFVAPHLRHHHVNDKEVEPTSGVGDPKRVPSAGCDNDFIPHAFQYTRGEFEDGVLVIHNQNAWQGLFHHMTIGVMYQEQ